VHYCYAIDFKFRYYTVSIRYFAVLLSRKFVLVWFSGHISSRVVYYLMNIRVLPRTIYITRVSTDYIHSCNSCCGCCFYGVLL